jgi:site-specific recombinase XerD
LLKEAEKNPKRRGRPPGQAKIARPPGLRLPDLAFLRAVAQGMRSNAAAKRYLVDLPSDERVAKRHVEKVTSEAVNLLLGIERPDMATNLRMWLAWFKGPEPAQPLHEPLPAGAELEEGDECDFDEVATEAEPRSPGQAKVAKIPTLEQFIEDKELEDFSESEAIAQYLEQYGEQIKALEDAKAEADTRDDEKAHTPIPDAVPVQAEPVPLTPEVPVLAVLAAIREVQARSVVPTRADPLSTWFRQSLVKRLACVQLRTLGDLCEFVRKYGFHWYRRIEGLGHSRGERIRTWLEDNQEHLGFAGASEALSLVFPVVPASTTAGALQTNGPNALGATSDIEALKSWLSTLDFLSVHTKRAYSRDVHRLLAWAHIELGKSLSDVTVRDAVAHAKFLQSPTGRWLAVPGQRSATGIAMRGPLAPSSAARALAAIGHFYGFLVETGYLSANPFARIRSPQDRGVQMDVQRSFSNGHLQMLQVALQGMPSSARKRRIVAILALLETTGLRVGEIPTSWDAVVQVADQKEGQVQCLKVVGKGGRERLLPLRGETLDALLAHRVDQIPSEQGQKPLIGLIEEPPNAGSAARGDLSTSRIRVVLKDFFGLVAEHPECPKEFVEDFKRATPHFIRHTFAHRVLAATNQDLAVTQQLLGHKSISTTGIYIKAGITQRAQAIAALQPISTAAAGGVEAA